MGIFVPDLLLYRNKEEGCIILSWNFHYLHNHPSLLPDSQTGQERGREGDSVQLFSLKLPGQNQRLLCEGALGALPFVDGHCMDSRKILKQAKTITLNRLIAAEKRNSVL